MQSDIKKYNLIENSKQIKVSDFSAPKKYYPTPMLSDYNKGIINRYFAIRINDNIVYEIDKNQYILLNTKNKIGIDYNLYTPVSLIWKISGIKNDIYKGNMIKVYGVEDTNRRTVERLAKTYPVIKIYLNNLLEFYLDIN